MTWLDFIPYFGAAGVVLVLPGFLQNYYATVAGHLLIIAGLVSTMLKYRDFPVNVFCFFVAILQVVIIMRFRRINKQAEELKAKYDLG